MKILITGGNGYLGSRLAKRLSKNHEITILGNEGGAKGNFIHKDIREKDLDLSEYGVIFHLAAVSLPGEAEKDRETAWDINVNGTKNIAQKQKKGQKLIFMSSSHVYSRKTDKPHTEDELPEPGNFYGLTKLAGEEIIRFYSKEIGFDYVIFRLFNSYSADQKPGLLVGDVIQKFNKGGKIEIRDPEFVLDMVHVDDVITVLEKAHEIENGTYNICSGYQISIKEIYTEIGEYLGKASDNMTMISNKIGKVVGDNSKLRKMGLAFRRFSLE